MWPFRSKLPNVVRCTTFRSPSSAAGWQVGWIGYTTSPDREPRQVGSIHSRGASSPSEAVSWASREIAGMYAKEPLAAAEVKVEFVVHVQLAGQGGSPYVVLDLRQEGLEYLTTGAWRLDTKGDASDLVPGAVDVRGGSLDDLVTKLEAIVPSTANAQLRWTRGAVELS
jgi:hypothetical protein